MIPPHGSGAERLRPVEPGARARIAPQAPEAAAASAPPPPPPPPPRPSAPSAPYPAGQANPVVRVRVPPFDHSDPATYYRALREVYGPVAPVLLDGGLPAWLVLGYREAHYVAGSPELFARDPRRWHAWDRIPEGWPLLPFVAYTSSVVFTEGAEHQRRSRAVSDVLAEVDPFALRLAAEQVADVAIDRFAGAGRADLMAEYAEPVPLRVLAGLFGLRDDETAELERDTAPALEGTPEGAAARGRVAVTMGVLLERVRMRGTPGGDIPSRLLAHPAGLTDDEVVQDLLTLLTSGRGPTSHWIANTLRLMLTDERFALTLSGGRRSVGQALTEVLWTDTPTQNVLGRWATRDTQLGGRHIRRGDCLVLGLAAANADPQICPGASGAVGNQAHLSFSHGEHRCPAPAQRLAEVIATAAVEVLLDRLPDLTPALPPDQLPWRPSLWHRAPASLPAEFTAL